MDSDKGLLVPIIYNGKWIKCDDDCWMFDALFTRYVRVRATTTYMELIDMICDETGISRDDNIIEVHGWMSYPVKEMSPPFIMLKDIDISIFIELNAKREVVVPLCISTSPKPKALTFPQRRSIALRTEKVPDVSFPGKGHVIGVPVDRFKVVDDIEEQSSSKEDNDEEDDGYVRRDPFDYENDDEDDDGYLRPDPFECAVDFDSYFRLYLESHPSASVNLQLNQGSTPPAPGANNPPREEEVSCPPSGRQGNSVPAKENTPMHKGSNRGRGRPQGKTVPLDVQSTNVHILQDFRVGDIVKSKAELMLRTRMLSVKSNREFKVTHSDRNRFIVACVDKTCKWRMRGSLSTSHCGWVIKSYEKQHSCSIDSRKR
ncbi:hypothetical protein Leryth_001204 [Lithospermum erythrorhizon]|nr:hypothetical protein Leryth_001204 [Lithospermum erythrorhizon]